MIILSICIYLAIGMVVACFMFQFIDKQIEEHESGKGIPQEDVERLGRMSEQAQQFGEKFFTVFYFTLCTVFWLPVFIYTSVKK